MFFVYDMTSQGNTTDALMEERDALESFSDLTEQQVLTQRDLFDTLEAKAREIYKSPQRTAMDVLKADQILHVISP